MDSRVVLLPSQGLEEYVFRSNIYRGRDSQALTDLFVTGFIEKNGNIDRSKIVSKITTY